MDEEPSGNVSIVDRVKAILLKPKEEWPVIDRETTPSGDVFTRYVMPLAAIGPVCSFIGGQLFGYGALFIRFRPSLIGSLTSAITSYVAALITVAVLTWVANMLAPKFGGEASQRSAFKLVAYSMTAGWVASVLDIIPGLGLIALLISLYGFYLFNVGATPLMKVPQDKAIGFTAVTAVIVVVFYIVVASVIGAVVGLVGLGSIGSYSSRAISGNGDVTVSVPGTSVTIDSRKIEQASRDMDQALKNGNGKAVDPAALQALLPDSIGAYKRTAVESMAAGPAGSHAEGTYEAGDKRFKLSVADMSAVGALAGIGAAMGVQSNQEDANGYERTTTTNGVLTTEKWHKSGDGTYGTMIGKRFFVQAEGEANNVGELRSAVASIDPGKLTALAGS